MLGTIGLLLASSLLGVALTKRLGLSLSVGDRIGTAMAGGLALLMALGTLSILVGISASAIITLTIVLLALGTEAYHNRQQLAQWIHSAQRLPNAFRWRTKIGWHMLGLVVLVLILGYLHYTHDLQPKTDGIYSAGGAWGDMAFHFSLANSFLLGDNFPPKYPVYSGWPLGYPFESDLLAATLATLGEPLHDAFWLSAAWASLALVVLLYQLYNALTGENRRMGGFLAVLLVLFSGGFGFYYFFQSVITGGDVQEALLKLDYAHIVDKGIHYTNITTAMLVPMRTQLFGMVVGLAVLLLVVRAQQQNQNRSRMLLAAGALAGLLPLIHGQSFLTIGFVVTVWALWEHQRWREWAWFYLPLAILAVPQLLWIQQHLQASSATNVNIITVQLGWKSQATNLQSWIWWWVKNAGLFAILTPIALACAPRKFRAQYVPFLAIFVLTNLFSFQPHDYDNIKYLAYVQVFSAITVGAFLNGLWARGRAIQTLMLILVIVSILAGGLSVARETQLSWQLADNQAIAFAQAVHEQTPPEAIFLTASNHNHPVPMLAGRTILLGYKGWLWTHGINYSQRERDVLEMYAGGPHARELLQQYKVSYVSIGPSERQEFANLNEDFFQRNFPKVQSTGAHQLYRTG